MTHARVKCVLPVSGYRGAGAKEYELRLVALGEAAAELSACRRDAQVMWRGKLRWNEYRRKDGTDASSWECVVSRLVKVDETEGAAGGGG